MAAEIEETEKPMERDKSDDRFKFSISLIVLTLTSLYNIYFYIQNNPIPTLSILLFIILFDSIAGALLFIIASLFLTALSYGLNSSKDIEYLETKANRCYLTGFGLAFSGLLITPFGLVVFFIHYVFINSVSDFLNLTGIQYLVVSFLSLFILFFLMMIIVIITLRSIKKSNSLKKIILNLFENLNLFEELKSFLKMIKFFDHSEFERSISSVGVCILSLAGIFLIIGNTSIEMNDISYKQNEQIPIGITVNGIQQFSNVVTLSKVNSDDNFTFLDSVEVKITTRSDKILSSKYLTCHIQNLGRYKVFINCTNLTKGYYKLSVNCPNAYFDVKKISKVFFLN